MFQLISNTLIFIHLGSLAIFLAQKKALLKEQVQERKMTQTCLQVSEVRERAIFRKWVSKSCSLYICMVAIQIN